MQTDNNLIQKIIGYILLSPALLSVVLFFAQLFLWDRLLQKFLFTIWTGDYVGEQGGGFTSALPFYFGLMAIAGAYLIKDSKK
jgi:hypothetical protein